MVKENKKLKLNIIDIIIVLFMILAVIGIFYRYNIADEINFNANSETFEIEFLVENVRRGTEDYLKTGEKFYINIESIEIGTVKEIIDVRDAEWYMETSESEMVRTTLPERVDVTGVMQSKGRTTKEGNVMINGNSFVSQGTKFFIHTGKRECWITVMNVTKVG